MHRVVLWVLVDVIITMKICMMSSFDSSMSFQVYMTVCDAIKLIIEYIEWFCLVQIFRQVNTMSTYIQQSDIWAQTMHLSVYTYIRVWLVFVYLQSHYRYTQTPHFNQILIPNRTRLYSYRSYSENTEVDFVLDKQTHSLPSRGR